MPTEDRCPADPPHIQRERARPDRVIRTCTRCGSTFKTDDFETYGAFMLRYHDWRGQHDECAPSPEIVLHGARHETPAPYDVDGPFDADELMAGFELVDERQVPVDPDSTLGRTMARAREAWAAPGYVPLDPDDFTVTPIPVDPDERED